MEIDGKYEPKHSLHFKNLLCKRCGKQTWGIAKYITSAGQVKYPWYCRMCGHLTTMYEPKHDHIIYTRVIDKALDIQCEKCGIDGAEMHHWAPAHLFKSDCDNWPVSYLCQKCHMEWHNIVTPNMGK